MHRLVSFIFLLTILSSEPLCSRAWAQDFRKAQKRALELKSKGLFRECPEAFLEAVRLSSNLGYDDPQRGQMSLELALSHARLGQYDKADGYAEACERQWKRCLGGDDERWLKLYEYRLMKLLASQEGKGGEANFQAAEKQARWNLAKAQKVFGDKDARSARAWQRLAQVMEAQAQDLKAERFHKRAVELCQSASGSLKLPALRRCARFYQRLGRLSEARKVLEAGQAVGEPKLERGAFLVAWAWLLFDSQELGPAALAMDKGIKVFKDFKLEAHPRMARALLKRSQLAQVRGRWSQAMTDATQAVAILDRALGSAYEDWPRALAIRVRAELGRVELVKAKLSLTRFETLLKLKKIKVPEVLGCYWLLEGQRALQAGEMARATLALRTALGFLKTAKDHRGLVDCAAARAELYTIRGQGAKAEAEYKALEAWMSSAYPKDERHWRRFAGDLALLRGLYESQSWHKFERRAKALEDAYKGLFGESHEALTDILALKADMALERNRMSQAEDSLRALMAARKAQLGGLHPKTSAVYERLGCFHAEKKKIVKAELYLKAALKGYVKVLGKDHWRLVGPYRALAEVALEGKRTDRALKMLLRARSLTEKNLGSKHPSLVPIYERLIKVLEKAKKKSAAKKLRERLKDLKKGLSKSS